MFYYLPEAGASQGDDHVSQVQSGQHE